MNAPALSWIESLPAVRCGPAAVRRNSGSDRQPYTGRFALRRAEAARVRVTTENA